MCADDKEAHALSFQPYPALAGTQLPSMHRQAITDLIAAGEFIAAQEHSLKLIETGLDGLRYFQT